MSPRCAVTGSARAYFCSRGKWTRLTLKGLFSKESRAADAANSEGARV